MGGPINKAIAKLLLADSHHARYSCKFCRLEGERFVTHRVLQETGGSVKQLLVVE